MMTLSALPVSRCIMFGASIVFVFVYAHVARITPGVYNSPDEAMHALAAAQFATEGRLGVAIPEHLRSYEHLDPRATFLGEGSVVPAGFLGLPLLYSFFIRLFGEGALMWITPLCGVALAWAVYALSRLVFNERVARISFALALLMPPLWYYASRGMFHNVLFSTLFFWGLYLVVYGAKRAQDKEVWYLLFGAVLFGFSLWVRLSEVALVGAVLLSIGILYRRHLSIKHTGMVCGVVALCILAYCIVAWGVFGVVLPGGYGVAISGAAGGQAASFLPFGFHPRVIAFNVYHYALRLLWWVTVPALVGAVVFFVRFKQEPQLKRLYAWLTGASFFVLVVLLYGNWMTFDNPNPVVVSITNAHVRYWIPLFVFALPWAAYAYEWLLHWFVPRARLVVVAVCALGVCYVSYTAVWRGPDGLSAVSEALAHGRMMQHELQERVTSRDLVIADREDKFFFPLFFVTRRFDYEGIHQLLVAGHSVWYVRDTHTPSVLQAQQELKQYGLTLELQEEWPPHALWRIRADVAPLPTT